MNPIFLFRTHLALLGTGLIQISSLHAGWKMEVLPYEWHLAGFENSLDLSGIAAASPTQCVVGSDESFYIQPGIIDAERHRIESQRPIALPIQTDPKKAEIDIEGVAFCGKQNAYFVVGSHGVGRKKGTFEPDRHSIFRIKVNPADQAVDKESIQRTSLLPWLQKTPVVSEHLKKPLQLNGLNIEGLAVSNERLFFGLRAPNKNGRGFVLETGAKELFEGKPGPMKVHELAIEDGRGIRDIVSVNGGFLLVTGNASVEASKKIPKSMAKAPDDQFDLFFWDGKSADPSKIGTLPANQGKGEGLLVLDQSEKHIDLLVIFDGLPGGEPVSISISR